MWQTRHSDPVFSAYSIVALTGEERRKSQRKTTKMFMMKFDLFIVAIGRSK